MSRFIKSHSNYLLKNFHQLTNDGTIYERDITTIGGVGNFPNGQVPIYRSNNFVITVRDNSGVSNQYNQKNWVQSSNGSDVWTMASLSGMSFDDTQNDTKIVLKQDYYDFRDFCYYGSLSEMFRASITDIINRFPGELYGTTNNVYYTTTETVDGSIIENRPILGSSNLKYIVNPFGIDMHSRNTPKDVVNPLKYFADGGYSAYTIDNVPITAWKSTYYYSEKVGKNQYIRYTASTDSSAVTSATSTTYYPCKGDKVADIVLNNTYNISAWIGDDDIIYYLSQNFSGKHITPKAAYWDSFYNECDNFQKLLLNPKTNPKYKATFSIIKENENGYYRDFEDFIFPTSEGGYNIDATSYGFNTYTTRLAQIGEFYDEFFTDNLYRSMTHEAIKNFDWTYTREYVEGDEEEYVLGGQKVQKALRVFAREFDEILSYINNIRNLNRITYDERSNLPDYFLTDALENDGWNVVLVTPYDAVNNVTFVDSDCATLQTSFFEASGSVKPYTYLSDRNGYFISCCQDGSTPCGYEGSKYKKSAASTNEFTRLDSCATLPIVRNRIKSYSEDKEYTYHDVNNEFLRRLKLNSRYIWRHKGTLDGIDMILGMFGMRNKKFNDSLSGTCKYDASKYDYEVTEYIASATSTVQDTWDNVHQMYHYDWINSTKTITYDYRSVSNYNKDGGDVNYIPYQGLPVMYEEKNNIRYLYPNFNKYEKYDGDFYYQMNGGWEDKAFISGTTEYHFQYDADDNIVYDKNNAMFKETVRNIRRFDTVQDMLSVPSYEIHDGQIVYVTNVQDNIAVLAGMVYNIKRDRFGEYIELTKQGGSVRAGDDYYFSDVIRVNGRDGYVRTVNINELSNGSIINCYIFNGTIECSDDYKSCSQYFERIPSNNVNNTNYFKITDFSQSNRLYNATYSSGGWKRLSKGDRDYKKINTIINDNKGNNPHDGMMVYDNGKEYFEYYKHLFKYALEHDLFDERCYDNFDASASTINGIGFSSITDYISDTKIHHIQDKTTITNQIFNTKVIKITFKLHKHPFIDKNGDCEMKYIDDIVMNYLTQMIPSTAILQIRYTT